MALRVYPIGFRGVMAFLCLGAALLLPGAAVGADGDLQGVLALSNGERIPLSEVAKSSPSGAKDLAVFHGITFNIGYYDPAGQGFNAPDPEGSLRRATLELALEYVADVINQPGGALDIEVYYKSVNSGELASAGPMVLWYLPVTPGINNGAPFEHLLDGSVDQYPGYTDMQLTVNWYHNYNLGSGTPGAGQYDLLSILIHEITHGLGYLSSIVYSDSLCTLGGTRAQGSGWTGNGPTLSDQYSTFDTLLQTGNGHPFINGSYKYVGQNTYFLGGDNGVFITGAQATAALGTNPRIYTPASFECGSSMSHWNFLGGIMDPAVSSGVTKRVYTDFEIGILRDIGYVNAAAPGAVEGEGEGVLEGEGEGLVEGEGEVPCELPTTCPDFNAEGAAFYTYLSSVLGQSLAWNSADVDGSGIPDSWEEALFERVICTQAVGWRKAAYCVFYNNLLTLRTESGYAALQSTENIVAGLLSISTEMQSALAPLGLTNTYAVIQDPAKMAGEPLAANGNADGDPYTNLVEYTNTVGAALTKNDFVVAALHPALDGSQSADDALPLGGGLTLAILLTGIAVAGPLVLLRRRTR